MLRRFTIENYRNFKEPLTLDFSDRHDYQFNDFCIKNDLVTKMIVFGNNGAGKSNLGYAIFDIVSVLTDKEVIGELLNEVCFLNADCKKKYATFTYEFDFDGTEVVYSYKKSTPNVIESEKLVVAGKCVINYDRHNEKPDIGESGVPETLNLTNIPDFLSVIRYIYNNSTLGAENPIAQMMNFVNKMLWFRSLNGRGYIGFQKGPGDLTEYIVNNNLTDEFQEFLHDVAGIDVQLEHDTDSITHKIRLVEKHSRRPLLFLESASTGTTELLLFFYWSTRFSKLTFLFVDEFDAFYHFKLSWNLVKYVSDLKDVQVVFTSHNTFLASNELLRPDCYMMLENGKIRSFADSTKRELREGHNLEKMLRNGEFSD